MTARVRIFLKELNFKYNSFFRKNKLLLSIYLFLLVQIKKIYYRNERLLINNKSIAKSDQNSIVFFTTYKCASTFLHKKLELLADDKNLITINFDSLLNYDQKQVFYKDSQMLTKIFKPEGYYFGPYRKFRNIPNLKNYKTVLVLRDPRDVITSHYFSTAFNHPVVNKKFLEFRKVAKTQTIDEYVISRLDEFKTYYEEYRKLLNLESVLFLKYEDMIEVFPEWFKKLTAHIGLGDNKDLINEIIQTSKFKVDKENPNAFIRNIKAGDHLEKLQPETIDILNREFHDVLQEFGYL